MVSVVCYVVKGGYCMCLTFLRHDVSDDWYGLTVSGNTISKIAGDMVQTAGNGGSLPTEIGMLTKLIEFKVKECNLGGEICRRN